MKLQINTDKTTPQDLRAAASMLLELAGTSSPAAEGASSPAAEPVVPVDLDIASGPVTGPPKVVTVWTSKGNEELAREHLNVADTVERVDVRIVNEEDDKEARLSPVLHEEFGGDKVEPERKTRKTRSDKGKTRKPVTDEAVDPVPIKLITTEDGKVVGSFDKNTGEVSGEIVRDPSLAANITVGSETNGNDLAIVRENIAALKERAAAREDQKPVLMSEYDVEKTDPKELPDPKAVVEAVVNVKTDTVEMEGSIDEALTAIDSEKPEGDLITEEQVVELRELRVYAAKLQVFPEFRKVIVDSCGDAGKFPAIPRDVADRIIPVIRTIIADAQAGASVTEAEGVAK